MPHPIDAYKHTKAYEQLNDYADHFQLSEENRFKLYESFLSKANTSGHLCVKHSDVNGLLHWAETWEGWSFWHIVHNKKYDKLMLVKVGNYPGTNLDEVNMLNGR